jgi:hypothetical protein
VSIDRPQEDEAPLDRGATVLADRVPAETRDRETYERELRAAVAADRWESAVSTFTERWSAHQRDHPSPPSKDNPRQLDAAADAAVDRACDRIREVEERVITPAMRDIESEDPDRSLIGLDHRLKGPDRLKEKVGRILEEQPDRTPSQAIALVADTVRFTFCYTDQHYADGVRADLDRLHDRGFESARPLKNSWGDAQYRGINSQWRDPESGQRFEVQFHTFTSFAAKQVTHGVYERIRSPETPDDERDELVAMQQDVTERIPVPSGAADIEDHARKEHNG